MPTHTAARDSNSTSFKFSTLMFSVMGCKYQATLQLA